MGRRTIKDMLNHKGTKEIRTNRLLLRKYRLSDAEEMFENYANDDRVTKYLPWKPYSNPADVIPFLEMTIKKYEEISTYNWAIIYQGSVIGGISAMSIDTMRNNCEVGYCIGYDFWNKGITSEALAAVIAFLFDEVGMHRIMAKHDIENPASGEVMKKCGMTYEGRFKEYYLRHDSTYSDALVYGIVNENIHQQELQSYRRVQHAAKQTIDYIKSIIKPKMNLREIRKACEEKLLELGADSFWYWDVGALVFAGEETTVSVSGKQYVTADRYINNNDIITIDLSPQIGNIWGDYARTIIVENGKVVDDIELIQNQEWKSGLQMEEKLHTELLSFVTKETTFEELYYHMNEFIVENGFVNLDFMGNLGHSIVKAKSDRIYIEKGNKAKLGEVNYFTFEPHIAFPDSKYGYKKENIYYYDGDVLVEL